MVRSQVPEQLLEQGHATSLQHGREISTFFQSLHLGSLCYSILARPLAHKLLRLMVSRQEFPILTYLPQPSNLISKGQIILVHKDSTLFPCHTTLILLLKSVSPSLQDSISSLFMYTRSFLSRHRPSLHIQPHCLHCLSCISSSGHSGCSLKALLFRHTAHEELYAHTPLLAKWDSLFTTSHCTLSPACEVILTKSSKPSPKDPREASSKPTSRVTSSLCYASTAL